MKTLSQSCAAVLMGVMLVLPALGTAEDKAPMPQTKGMAGMDPKAHEMDCPEATIKAEDKAKHVHKAPGG